MANHVELSFIVAFVSNDGIGSEIVIGGSGAAELKWTCS